MPDPFSSAGAVKDNTRYAPLTMDRYITGLVTQCSPLRDAAVAYAQAKYYQAGRFDKIIDGLNTEINAKSNLARRVGATPYNSQTFPAVGRFAEHRIVVDGIASIRVMADTATAVYDATGPSTKKLIWTKSAGAGKTFFQSVGNTLYMANGVDNKRWTIPAKTWKASTLYKTGDAVPDTNGNLQVAFGSASANVVSSSIQPHPHAIGFPPIASDVTLVLDVTTLPFVLSEPVSFYNLNLAGVLNGQSLPIDDLSPGQITLKIPLQTTSYFDTPDSGVVLTRGDSSLSGTTGVAAPAWATGLGAATNDGTVLWINKGSAVQNWGGQAPSQAPTLTQVPLMGNYASWAANTYYFEQQIITDSTRSKLLQLYLAGTTAAAEPPWTSSLQHLTSDGTASWLTTLVTIPGGVDDLWPASTNAPLGSIITAKIGTITYVMKCVNAGLTGTVEPGFTPELNSQTPDNIAIWKNLGPLLEWTDIGPTQAIEKNQAVLDAAGYLQQINTPGISGAVVPTWNDSSTGALTTDNTMTWINSAAVAVAATASCVYAVAFRSSTDGTVTDASEESVTILLQADRSVLIQGIGPTDPQFDTIVIYRTPRGGSTLLFRDEIPITGLGKLWTYVDSPLADSGDLDIETQAALNHQNDPPPLGLSALTYHLGRIWGAVNGLVYYSDGPDVGGNGNGNTAWSPGNIFAFPDPCKRIVPVTISNGGLLIFTTADMYAIFGTGTASNPFYDSLYGKGIGLLSYDALDIIGATIHLHTTARKQVSLDPSAGYVETGQPIGDQFKTVTTGGINSPLYSPANTYVTWHEAESGDTGLYVADGSVGWFRYSPISAPETGFLWSPRAAIEGGTSAVQSVETAPGVKQLLIGPKTSGKILARDTSTNADNAVPYGNAYAVIGSIQLCQPYEIAEVAGIVIDSMKVGTPPTIGLLFGEIFATTAVPFTMYARTSNDPPLLPASTTVNGDRFVMLQKGKCPKHRHVQLLIQFASENAANEILTHTIYGSISQERKVQ